MSDEEFTLPSGQKARVVKREGEDYAEVEVAEPPDPARGIQALGALLVLIGLILIPLAVGNLWDWWAACGTLGTIALALGLLLGRS